MIQAIQTSYKGYRMRSRTEAKWAVWMDTLHIPWQYETQGFVVNGEPYLPDFWIPYEAAEDPTWGFWLEIKPHPLNGKQIIQLDALARQSGHRSFAICGDPWPGKHVVYVFQHYHVGRPERIPLVCGEFYELDWMKFVEGKCVNTELYVVGGNRKFQFPSPVNPAGLLSKAFSNARSARFEHGEVPQIN